MIRSLSPPSPPSGVEGLVMARANRSLFGQGSGNRGRTSTSPPSTPHRPRRASPLKPTGLAQPFGQPDPGRRQRPVHHREDEGLKEMAGQVQAGADIPLAQAALGRQHERRQPE